MLVRPFLWLLPHSSNFTIVDTQRRSGAGAQRPWEDLSRRDGPGEGIEGEAPKPDRRST